MSETEFHPVAPEFEHKLEGATFDEFWQLAEGYGLVKIRTHQYQGIRSYYVYIDFITPAGTQMEVESESQDTLETAFKVALVRAEQLTLMFKSDT